MNSIDQTVQYFDAMLLIVSIITIIAAAVVVTMLIDRVIEFVNRDSDE